MAKKASTKPAVKRKPAAKKAPAKPDVVSPVKSSSPWRRSMLVGGVVAGLVASFVGGAWSAGGWQIGPGPLPADSVSAVFDAQESAFRKYSGELAVELKTGRITSEKAAADWMDSHFGPESEKAWIPLITEESKAFGGKDWTAEKQAAHIERYSR